MPQGIQNHERNLGELTSRDLPHPSSTNTKFSACDFDSDATVKDPEYHMVLPGVLHSLDAARRKVNHAGMEER